jgi:hypothetical protein
LPPLRRMRHLLFCVHAHACQPAARTLARPGLGPRLLLRTLLPGHVTCEGCCSARCGAAAGVPGWPAWATCDLTPSCTVCDAATCDARLSGCCIISLHCLCHGMGCGPAAAWPLRVVRLFVAYMCMYVAVPNPPRVMPVGAPGCLERGCFTGDPGQCSGHAVCKRVNASFACARALCAGLRLTGWCRVLSGGGLHGFPWFSLVPAPFCALQRFLGNLCRAASGGVPWSTRGSAAVWSQACAAGHVTMLQGSGRPKKHRTAGKARCDPVRIMDQVQNKNFGERYDGNLSLGCLGGTSGEDGRLRAVLRAMGVYCLQMQF